MNNYRLATKPKNNMAVLTFLFLLLGYSTIIQAQDNALEWVKKEVKEITIKEQDAFKNGDCDIVMSLMDENITFHANGRSSPPKSVIERFCQNIPRPFGELNKESLTVHPLNKDAAYVIRTLEYDKNEEVKVMETVTKIWNRIDGKWKMVHLHSTVKEVPNKE